MPTPSEQRRNLEGGVRDAEPRSVFGNFHENAIGELNASLPLTPTLSLGQREAVSPSHEESKRSDSPSGRTTIPPLPEGEGRGEGEESIGTLQRRIDAAVARSFLHRFVANLFEYPSAETWAWLSKSKTTQAVSFAAAVLNLNSSAEDLLSAIRGSSIEGFLDAHLAAFGHAARGPVPMNEIEYGDLKADPLFQPHRLADLAAFYRAFGLEVAPDASERQDHICLQLEFMSVLAAKEAYALEHQLDGESISVCRGAQKNFLREHLGRWTPAFARRVERSTDEPTLGAAAQFTHAFITAECERFAVKPGSEDLILRRVDEDAEQLCAACGIRELPPGAVTST